MDQPANSAAAQAMVTRLQPVGLPRNPAFAQGVSVDGPVRTIYVAGQNGVTADGTISGGDAGSQTGRRSST